MWLNLDDIWQWSSFNISVWPNSTCVRNIYSSIHHAANAVRVSPALSQTRWQCTSLCSNRTQFYLYLQKLARLQPQKAPLLVYEWYLNLFCASKSRTIQLYLINAYRVRWGFRLHVLSATTHTYLCAVVEAWWIPEHVSLLTTLTLTWKTH